MSRPGTPAATTSLQAVSRPVTPSDLVRPVTPSEIARPALPVSMPAAVYSGSAKPTAATVNGNKENTNARVPRAQTQPTVAEMMQYNGYECFQSKTDKLDFSDVKGSTPTCRAFRSVVFTFSFCSQEQTSWF